MTTLLAFETATEACSVALWIDGEVRERFEIAPRRHAELALPWADALLAEAGLARAQLDAIAVGRGPGAFTGVRLAIALAQGIALALDRPVLPVSTLATLAMRARVTTPAAGAGSVASASPTSSPLHVLAAIDARMGEIYLGAFRLEAGRPTALAAECVGAPDAVPLPDQAAGWHGVGTGLTAADGALPLRLGATLVAADPTALPRAADLACLAAQDFADGLGVAPERVEPAYLRNQVALTLRDQAALRAARDAG